MDYKQKLESIKTVEELFGFRKQLNSDKDALKDLFYIQKIQLDPVTAAKHDECNFYLKQVVAQIDHLAKKGVFLASVAQKNPTTSNVLDLKFYSKDLDRITSIRNFFFELMEMLWVEQENFNSKRPFGNSD